MALRTLGATPVAMGSILPTTREYVEPPDAEGPVCFGCSSAARKLVRLHLEHRRPGRGGRGRVVGSLLLCEKCWKDCRE